TLALRRRAGRGSTAAPSSRFVTIDRELLYGKHFCPLDSRRRIDVRNRDLDVLDRAVDVAQPVWCPGKIDHDVAGPDLAGQAAFDAGLAPDRRVRIRVGIRIAVDGRRD